MPSKRGGREREGTERLAQGSPVSLVRPALIDVDDPEGAPSYIRDEDVLIGSGPGAAVRLDDRSVSKRHAIISSRRGEIILRDLGSTNGTRVNGRRVVEAFLQPGDVIELGRRRLKLECRSERAWVDPTPADELGRLYGKSLAMRQLFGILQRVSASESSVLIRGETGTGKDLVARTIHEHSSRASGPFVVFDCASVTRDLLASELFGHAEGAFTGASRQRSGAFQAAQGGTLLLDEIGELPLEAQPKLLRALESREVRPVGTTRPVPVDVRVLSATHRNLAEMVREGLFRQDLYFRLAVASIEVPPLRERREDVPGLAQRLLAALASRGRSVEVTPEASRFLSELSWPGNVRELRNMLERVVTLSPDGAIEPRHLLLGTDAEPASGRRPAVAVKPLDEIERDVIARALEMTSGHLARTAALLGIHRDTLRAKMKRHGLKATPAREA